MATTRPFAYNPGSPLAGTEQLGQLAIGIDSLPYAKSYGGVKWWNGPDEDLGYIIASADPGSDQPTPDGLNNGTVSFWRSDLMTEGSFVQIAELIAGQSFASGDEAKTWHNAHGNWTNWGLQNSSLVLYLDPFIGGATVGDNTWSDLSQYGNHMVLNGVNYNDEGYAMQFSGSSYASLDRAANGIPTGSSDYCISMWVLFTGAITNDGLIGWGNWGSGNQTNALRTNGIDHIVNYWWGNDLDVSTGSALQENTAWYNVVATMHNGVRSIYLNGVLLSSDSPSGHSVSSADNLRIGVTNLTEYLSGQIAQVRVYNTGLSSSEVYDLWLTYKNRFGYAGKVLWLDAAYYPGAGGGSIWYDLLSSKQFNLYGSTGLPTYDASNGGVFIFDSSDGQYAASATSLPADLPNWTVEAWHYFDNTNVGSGMCIVTETYPGTTNRINFSLGDNLSGDISGGFFSGGWFTSGTYSLTPNTWYHLVATYDGSTIKLWANNTLVASNANSNSANSSQGGIRLMSRWDGADYWGGRLAIVNIYENALSSIEISQNWLSTKSRFGY